LSKDPAQILRTTELSGAAAELDDVAAVAFGRASGRELFEFAHGSAFGGNFLAKLAAGFGFAVES
jgi:hypothetical protein